MQCLIPGLKWSELDGKAQTEMSLGRAHACGRAELALQASSCCFSGSSKLLALCLLLQWSCPAACSGEAGGGHSSFESGTDASRCPTPGCGGSRVLSVGIPTASQGSVKKTPSRPSAIFILQNPFEGLLWLLFLTQPLLFLGMSCETGQDTSQNRAEHQPHAHLGSWDALKVAPLLSWSSRDSLLR